MPQTAPRIDAFIAKAQPFAQPILKHVRALVRTAVPEAEETIKWSMPHFSVNGKILAGMAAFKAHAAFFVHGAGRMGEGEGMGSFGKLTSLSDLPPDSELGDLLRKGRDAIVAGAKPAKAPKAPKPEISMQNDFAAALASSAKAQATFDSFPPSARREYLEWVVDAKRPETRAKRIAQAVEWLAEGKKRNWKYESC